MIETKITPEEIEYPCLGYYKGKSDTIILFISSKVGTIVSDSCKDRIGLHFSNLTDCWTPFHGTIKLSNEKCTKFSLVINETRIGHQIWSDLIDIDVPGSVKVNGIRYYTYEQALKAAKIFANVCGKEWRLPSKEDFIYLVEEVHYNPNKLVESGFVKTGYYYDDSVTRAGSWGYYWSSTWYNSGYAYYLNFNSGGVGPQGNSNEYYGFAVRCVKNI